MKIVFALFVAICVIATVRCAYPKFTDFAEWFTDIETRLDEVEKDAKVDTEKDDAKTIRTKAHTVGHTGTARRLIATYKKKVIASSNLSSIGPMLSIESSVSRAGRELYGTKWNELDCGPGLNVTVCGKKAA